MQLLLLLLLLSPDAVYLEHRVLLDCSSPDSGYTEITSETVVPLSARGVQRYSQIVSSFRNTWESLRIEASVSHWRPGRGEDPAEIHEEPHSVLLQQGRLESSLREVTIFFPGLEIGDTLHIRIERNIQRLPLDDLYSHTFYAASRDSIARGVFKVLWPREKQLLVSSDGDFETYTVPGEDGNSTLFVWESPPFSPLPRLPFSRDRASMSPHVNVAGHSAPEVSRKLYEVMIEQCLTEDPALADSVIRLVGDDPLNLCRWVSHEIEYLSGDWGSDPGYSPRSPQLTVNERAGVCRDRAVLLLWLLSRVGYSPRAVLTSISGHLPEYPGSRSFDHMLVEVEDEEGTLYLDPSGSCSRSVSSVLRGRPYLPLSSPGSSLDTFPDTRSFDSLLIDIEGVYLADSSIIRGNLNVDFSGSVLQLYGSMLSSVGSSNLKDLLTRLFGCLQGSDLAVVGDLEDPEAGLRVEGTGAWMCTVLSSGEAYYVLLPGLETMDVPGGRAAALILPGFRDLVTIETPCTAFLNMRIAGFGPESVSLPEPVETDNFSCSSSLRGDTLIFRQILNLQPHLPEPSELEMLRNSLTLMLSAQHRTVKVHR
ncbi:MAG: DUF3857 domain-containing protein [Candidatus Aegiribacteria sp.]|nr:DUF3857 domain-containing protein [Candidatus Aegiribacteria sp.]MBD3295691.1 DUF3857 domain-containing protein [Candidatus Fermentibacteria bacterium]